MKEKYKLHDNIINILIILFYLLPKYFRKRKTLKKQTFLEQRISNYISWNIRNNAN